MNVSRTGWLQSWSGLAWSAIAACVFGVSVAGAEQDHLEGYKIKDDNRILAPGPVTIQNAAGTETCELKRAKFFLRQSEKNGGNDPRGGPPGDFVCYKAKCAPAPSTAVVQADSQFGVHALVTRKAQLICLPVDQHVCGDGELDPGEACDGAAGVCAGVCSPTCACNPPACGDGVVNQPSEQCELADDAACPDNCTIFCNCAACLDGGLPQACLAFDFGSTCQPCCAGNGPCNSACQAAAAPGTDCTDPTLNDACTAAVNSAGCADECCVE